MPLYIFSGGAVSGSGVSGLTPNEVTFGDAAGLLDQSPNFKFDGSLLTSALRAVIGGTADPGSRALAVSGALGTTGQVFVTGVPAGTVSDALNVICPAAGLAATFSDNSAATLYIQFNTGSTASIRVDNGLALEAGKVGGANANAHVRIFNRTVENHRFTQDGSLVVGGTAPPGSQKLAVSGGVGISNPGGTALTTTGTLSFLGTVANAAGTLMTLNDVSGLLTHPLGNTVLGGSSDPGSVTLAVTGSVNITSLLRIGISGTNVGGASAPLQIYGAGNTLNLVRDTTNSVEFAFGVVGSIGDINTQTNHPLRLRTNNGADAIRVVAGAARTVFNGTADPGSVTVAVSGNVGMTGYLEVVPATVGTPATTWTTGATTTAPQGFLQVHVSGTSFYVPLYR